MSSSLLKYQQIDPVKLRCEIDLDKLLPTKAERQRFDRNWETFLASDKNNTNIFDVQGRTLSYESEQLIPVKTDERLPLLLVLGNPASHSVYAGMFFAYEGNRKEHRFWKNILKQAGILDLPDIIDGSIEQMNNQRKQQLLNLDYDGPFRIGLSVFISIPSAPSGDWGGIAGVQKLLGLNAFKRLEKEETHRIYECVNKFIGSSGIVVVFQKNAWNALRSAKDPEYGIDKAKEGALKGVLNNGSGIRIFGVPPTRLSGPCCRILGLLTNQVDFSMVP